MKKSLLIVTEAFDLGGVETYIQGEIVALVQQGWEVHLACGRQFSPQLVPPELTSLTSGLELGPDISIATFLQTIDRLRALVRELGIAVIHAHPFSSLVPSLACAEKEGLPMVVTLHGPSSVVGSYGAGYDFLNTQLVLPGASMVVAVSREIAQLASPYVEAGALRVQLNTVQKRAAPISISAGDQWLMVSRLDSDKCDGIVAFIDAARTAGLGGVDIVGAGDAEHVLVERLAPELNSGFVRMLGRHDDVPELIPGYAGVAGMGRVALEGAIQGVPVALCGYDGVKGILDDALYDRAISANLSGREVPSLGPTQAVAALRGVREGTLVPIGIDRICEAHSPEQLWGEFAAQLELLRPVCSSPLAALVHELRAGSPRSTESAYWSPRFMSAMGRVVAANALEKPQLAAAYSIFSEEFSRRAIIQQQADIRLELGQRIGDIQSGIRSLESGQSALQSDVAMLNGTILAEQREHLIGISTRMDDINGSLHGQVLQLERQLTEVYASSSWRLTTPLRMLKRLIVTPGYALRQLAYRLDQMLPDSWMRRIRSGWRFVLRTVRNGRIDPSDRARLRSIVAPLAAVAAQPGSQVDYSGMPRLAAKPSCSDVFVWAVIDWHFRMQRPQHLAMAMAAKGHRVFYISNNFVDSAAPGFSAEPLDESGRLFQVKLHVKGAPQIYHAMPDGEQAGAIASSLATLLGWTQSTKCISFVQHPYWLQPAQCLPNMQLVYDCMDHHGGFEDNAPPIMAAERELIQSSDLLVVTSQWLHDELSPQARNIAMVRNATEYSRFCTPPEKIFADSEGRKVIGYYGAIAEWFDVELLRKVALDNPDTLVLMVGRDTAGVAARLSGLGNIRFVGEVAYEELPYWLYGFDVCLLPFRVIPLTLATNPVKVYEYLSAGKAVVSVDLPELSQFEGLVRLAANHEGFLAQVKEALVENADDFTIQERRHEFAARQTWLHRAAALDEAVASIEEPLVSIVVLTYNNLEYTKECLRSLELYTDYQNVELIVVDNASTDGSPEFLAQWASAGKHHRFIANDCNLGFSAGNNVGLRVARGDYLVVLNNDTYVTPGWVRTLRNHFRRHASVGLVGPVTNNIGNEAKIEINYASMDEMIEQAGRYTRAHAGVSFPMETSAFFCMMISREAFQRVGELDEQFGVGFFEDDDYCRRLEQTGMQRLCAEDVFVHHQLSASFNKLKAEAKQALFEKNKSLFEAKWGAWKPHEYKRRSN